MIGGRTVHRFQERRIMDCPVVVATSVGVGGCTTALVVPLATADQALFSSSFTIRTR